ncbi:MAG: hypothetical protein FWD23_10685, partial [Oscillospiraceae bacterium]|nr:hypothetical protein [Oscillospiraceae bacterium]
MSLNLFWAAWIVLCLFSLIFAADGDAAYRYGFDTTAAMISPCSTLPRNSISYRGLDYKELSENGHHLINSSCMQLIILNSWVNILF